MGSFLEKLPRARDFVSEQIELAINTAFFELDCVLRYLSNGNVGEIWNFFEEIYLKWYYGYYGGSTQDKEESDAEKICVDKEGLHFVGESWNSKNQCSLRKCIALDVIKELKCPEIEKKEGCRIKKGDPDKAFPDCCDRQICPYDVYPLNVAPPQETWIRNESADWVFETSSGEEADDNFREWKVTEKGMVRNDRNY